MEPGFDMIEFIQKKLGNMKDLSQKKILSEVLNDVFISLYEQSEQNYEALSDRVKNEFPLPSNKYVLYTTMFARKSLDSTHSFLRPIIHGDLHPFAPTLSAGDSSVMDTVFLEMDILACYLAETKEFSGKVLTNQGVIPARFKLIPSKRYQQEIYFLYQLFVFNQIPWQTINAPYLVHFYDVVPIWMETIPENTSFEGVEVDYEKITPYVKNNLIPVWNLDDLQLMSKDFPMPALDKKNYEYALDTFEIGEKHGYLIKETMQLLSVRHEKNRLIAVSNEEQGILWDLKRVLSYENRKIENLFFPLYSNLQVETFGYRMLSKLGTQVKSRGEIRRLLYSMSMEEHFRLIDMEIIQGKIRNRETYEVNWFIKDEIRDIAISKTLLLTFETKSESIQWFERDLLSYYTSQIQLIYPEYHVEAILLERGQGVTKGKGEGLPI